MLTEENPEAFAPPEQKDDDDSKKKKKHKKKKKNNENSAQPNEHPHLQVCSEPLVVVTPNQEIKSSEESSLPKKKKSHKKKSVINAEVEQPNREESKPSLDLEIEKIAEPVGVSVEGAETVTGKRKRKSKIGKLDEVVVVENALKHDHDQEQLNTVDTEEKTGKKHKRKRNKSELDGLQSNEQNIELGETAVRTSIIDREVPPVDPTILGNTRPVNLSELEHEYLDRKWNQRKRKGNQRKRKGELKSKEEEKAGKTIEIQVQRPIDPITEPSTDPAIIINPHPATPIDAAQKIAKKRKKKKRKCESYESDGGEKNEEHNGKLCESEAPAQKSIISTTVPSGVPIDQVISIDPACPTAAPPVDAAIPEQKTSKKKRKMKGGLKSKALESDICNAGSTAETSVQGTKRVKVTNAPYYQHGISSMICWACRETDHTIQQCQKLKYLSKDEEICFFCGEIGHSLGKCSVYKAGGGRLARCLFCDAHGHFSYNCPGNGHDPKWPVEDERKIQC
ncbi:unnamed protein product [Lathyrus sativus]|nr:unnamed protein product [Lathyrus sativus]